jgi:hypothetical protein
LTRDERDRSFHRMSDERVQLDESASRDAGPVRAALPMTCEVIAHPENARLAIVRFNTMPLGVAVFVGWAELRQLSEQFAAAAEEQLGPKEERSRIVLARGNG